MDDELKQQMQKFQVVYDFFKDKGIIHEVEKDGKEAIAVSKEGMLLMDMIAPWLTEFAIFIDEYQKEIKLPEGGGGTWN